MPARDLALLSEAARAAGPVALRYWKNAPRAWEKDGNAGPVTEADLAVNLLLEQRLRSARPDYGWLSEESADSGARQGAERVFIVDPIDGTRAFMAGEDTFSVSLAVAYAGRIVAAAVYLPALDRLYTAGERACAARRAGHRRQSARREPGRHLARLSPYARRKPLARRRAGGEAQLSRVARLPALPRRRRAA